MKKLIKFIILFSIVLIFFAAGSQCFAATAYKVTGNITPDATGNYFFAGTYLNSNYYKRTGVAYYLWRFSVNDKWLISLHLHTNDPGYWQSTLYVIDGNYPAEASYDGTAIVNQLLFNLTVAASSGGTVQPSAGTYSYDYNSTVDINAVANSNYTFSHWTGDVNTIADVNDATTTIVIQDSNYSITANFLIIDANIPDTNTVISNCRLDNRISDKRGRYN